MHMFADYLSFIVLLLGLGLMLLEAMIFCYGLFSVIGLLFFSVGLFILVQGDVISQELAYSIAMGAAISNLGLLAFAGYLAWRAQSKQPVSGMTYMLGQTAEVVQCLPCNLAWVRLTGELWQASSDKQLKVGQMVTVLEVNGLMLKVEPISNQ